MTSYNLGQISHYLDGRLHGNPEVVISNLSIDSRKLVVPRESLFFALKTERNNGHQYIENAYEKGVRSFVVHESYSSELEANFIKVNDTLEALQRLSAEHRAAFKKELLAITGSNGKTTVKEWLSEVLSEVMTLSVSPRSYNSQVGVPLSLWQIKTTSDLAIVEAGISLPKEMSRLEKIIQPTIGLVTNIGDAHLHNFSDRKELIREKLDLFKGVDYLLCNTDQTELFLEIKSLDIQTYTWGKSQDNDLVINTSVQENSTKIHVVADKQPFEYTIPFTDAASIENVCHVICVCKYLGIHSEALDRSLRNLKHLDMRHQVLKGINNCILINDSYTADIKALESALDLASTYATAKEITLILSDFLASTETTYHQISNLLKGRKIKRLITIGIDETPAIGLHQNVTAFTSIQEFLKIDLNDEFSNDVIVIKGARKYKLENVAHRLQLKDHQTVLEINLNAFTENLTYYREKLNPKTKIMAMVKAFSYGSGSYEVAAHLESLGVNFLAVAYADEGIELRKNGIQLPILVLNPEPSAFESIIRYNLQPELFSLELLTSFKATLEKRHQHKYPVHLKLDTGMHRLGFEQEQLKDLIHHINGDDTLSVVSIFSHLAASDSAEFDAFTQEQIQRFEKMSTDICMALDYSPIRHLCNSEAIVRFPQAQHDMVRAGIGLYGLSSDSQTQKNLKLAGQLKTTIIQTRVIEEGESLGYNRAFIAKKRTRVGILPVGYADGLFRALGNGNLHVTIGKQRVPIIGNICMDLTFVDLTKSEANTSDQVVIFSKPEHLKEMARRSNTIPYEILSSISHRVKRTYFLE